MNSPVEDVSNPIRKRLVTLKTAKCTSGHLLPDRYFSISSLKNSSQPHSHHNNPSTHLHLNRTLLLGPSVRNGHVTSATPIKMLEALCVLIWRRPYEGRRIRTVRKKQSSDLSPTCLTCFVTVHRCNEIQETQGEEAATSKWKQPEGSWKYNPNHLS